MLPPGLAGEGFTEEKLALGNGRIWTGLEGDREHPKETGWYTGGKIQEVF